LYYRLIKEKKVTKYRTTMFISNYIGLFCKKN